MSKHRKHYISQELHFVILKTSSVKSLLRFRCVCKSWKEHIDSKPFILEHLAFQKPQIMVHDNNNNPPKYAQYEPQTLTLLSSHELDSPVNVKIKDEVSRCHIRKILRETWCFPRVVATLDGVICIYDCQACFFLWNPSIRRLMGFPIPQVSICRDIEFPFIGFWIEPSKNFFKVVVFSLKENTIALFSSRKRAWTKVDIEPFVIGKYRRGSRNPQILVDNVAHWTAYDHSRSSKQGVIFSFDFQKEKFGLFKFPKLLVIREYCVDYPRLMKWHGFVAIADLKKSSSPFGCDLWAMQNGTWNKMLSFNIVPSYIDRVLHVAEDNRKVLVWSKYQRFGSYDSKDGGYINLASRQLNSFEYDFVESFVFPNRRWVSS